MTHCGKPQRPWIPQNIRQCGVHPWSRGSYFTNWAHILIPVLLSFWPACHPDSSTVCYTRHELWQAGGHEDNEVILHLNFMCGQSFPRGTGLKGPAMGGNLNKSKFVNTFILYACITQAWDESVFALHTNSLLNKSTQKSWNIFDFSPDWSKCGAPYGMYYHACPVSYWLQTPVYHSRFIALTDQLFQVMHPCHNNPSML